MTDKPEGWKQDHRRHWEAKVLGKASPNMKSKKPKYSTKRRFPIKKLFHGTTDVVLGSIREKGLLSPSASKTDKKGGEFEKKHADTVYFTEDYDSAEAIAYQSVYAFGGKAVVIKVDTNDMPSDAKIKRRHGEVAVETKNPIPIEEVIRPSWYGG